MAMSEILTELITFIQIWSKVMVIWPRLSAPPKPESFKVLLFFQQNDCFTIHGCIKHDYTGSP